MGYVAHIEARTYQTKERLEFITITKDVEEIITNSGVENGMVLVQTMHTTCALWINEDEKNLIGPESALGYTPDLMKVLDRFAAPDEKWGHNDIRDQENPNGRRDTHLCDADSCGVIMECRNGHAHAHAMLFPTSLTLVVKDGKLVKGQWQELLLVELDHDRPRTVNVLVQGAGKE